MNESTEIYIDNGHGVRQYMKGMKQSPDNRLFEGEWTREIVDRIVTKLIELGYKAYKLVPEELDIPLSARVKRVNSAYIKNNKNIILISIHVNAAGSDSKWHNASGWSVWVAPKSSNNSKKLAKILYEESEKLNLQGNRCVPKEKYWIGNFAIVRDTKCPAVLTENLFLDNKNEVDYLLSEKGKEDIVNLHVNGILNYLNGTSIRETL